MYDGCLKLHEGIYPLLVEKCEIRNFLLLKYSVLAFNVIKDFWFVLLTGELLICNKKYRCQWAWFIWYIHKRVKNPLMKIDGDSLLDFWTEFRVLDSIFSVMGS